MDEITLNKLVETIKKINTGRFLKNVDSYIKAAFAIDNDLKQLEDPAHWLDRQKILQEKIDKEASRILFQSTLCASRLINFPFHKNGLSGKSHGKTVLYLKKIKKHQMELLSSVCDDIEIIRNIIKHTGNLRKILGNHSKTIGNASFLMDVIRDRINRRPTTLLRLNAKGKKADELNRTIDKMLIFENRQEEKIRKDAENNPANKALFAYLSVTDEICSGLNKRQISLSVNIKELKKGNRLLIKLVSKGYSPFMKKSLDTLIKMHESRTRKFKTLVHESRKICYIEKEYEKPIF